MSSDGLLQFLKSARVGLRLALLLGESGHVAIKLVKAGIDRRDFAEKRFTGIVGALAKVTGVIDVEVFKGLLAKNLSKKFGQEMIDANFAAVNRAYEEVTVA